MTAARWARAGPPIALLLFALLMAPTLDQPLLEAHGFRQTQTAWTARWFHEHGVSLMRPVVPVFGRGSQVLYEFPAFQAAAAGVMSFGVREDVALRVTGLLCFLASAWLLHRLVLRLVSAAAATASLTVYLLSPFSILWSRTAMIEFLAVASGLLWVLGFLWVLEGRSNGWLVPAVLGGVTAGLVKPTTALAYGVLGLALVTIQRAGLSRQRIPGLLTLISLPVCAALLWTRWADATKAASPMTAWLTSSALKRWNFGTLDQRLSLPPWQQIGTRASGFVLGGGIGLLGLLVGLVATRFSARWVVLSFVAAAVVPVIVFFNLYAVHDYYLAAVAPLLAAAAGIGLNQLATTLARFHPGGFGRTLSLPVLLATWACGAFATSTAYASLPFRDLGPERAVLDLAVRVAAATGPDDLVAVDGFDWDPRLLYYARREGIMLADKPPRSTGIETLAAQQPTLLVRLARALWRTDVLTEVPWVSPAGRQLVRLSWDPEPPDANVVASMQQGAPSFGFGIPEMVAVHCGGEPITVPAGPGLVMRRIGDPPAGARLVAGLDGMDLPVPMTIIIRRLDGPEAISCIGQGTVHLMLQPLQPPNHAGP